MGINFRGFESLSHRKSLTQSQLSAAWGGPWDCRRALEGSNRKQ